MARSAYGRKIGRVVDVVIMHTIAGTEQINPSGCGVVPTLPVVSQLWTSQLSPGVSGNVRPIPESASMLYASAATFDRICIQAHVAFQARILSSHIDEMS